MIALIVAWIFIIASIVYGGFVWIANSMSDAPSYQASYWPSLIGLAVAILIFIGRRNGG